MQRRGLVKCLLGGAALAVAGRRAEAQTPGVTPAEIKIGCTTPLSGPASAYGVIARTTAAYFNMINDQGGVAGHKINFIYLDDGYSPPRAVEQVRKLVEEDEVDFLFQTLGTPSNTAIRPYCNQHKIPQLFVSSGADKWGDYKHFPYTVGFNPSYRTEADIYAKYILKDRPTAKVALLYQNDDFGKDYVNGLKQGFGDEFDKMLVKIASYEVTDPTVDSQIVTLQGSGADTLVTAATPKFAAQAIRKVADLGWKPLHIMSNVSVSVGAVLQPAGLENSIGLITAGYVKDPTDKQWDNDAGMKEWRAFAAKYLPGADLTDGNITYAYGAAFVMTHVLRQCGTDFSRENVLKQALNIDDLKVPVFYQGIKLATSQTNHQPIQELQLAKFNGHNFEPFGGIIRGVERSF